MEYLHTMIRVTDLNKTTDFLEAHQPEEGDGLVEVRNADHRVQIFHELPRFGIAVGDGLP